ncbi:MAG: hypothetical protein ACX936_04765 [Marinobacter sp.]
MSNPLRLQSGKSRNRVFLIFAIIFLVVGTVLMAINLYGLTQPIRKPGLGVEDRELLRFVPEEVWSYERSMKEIDGLSEIENKDILASRANEIVNKSMVHPQWTWVDRNEYRQLVPVWENYYLWFLGLVTDMPQIQRYHYANYKRNIKRGIGVCGDFATVHSSILDRYGIENRLASFSDGHVVVEYESENSQSYVMDPDFGVELGMSLEEVSNSPELVRSAYADQGYSTREIDTLVRIYGSGFSIFDDTYNFMAKRYVFEEVSYVMKWVAPLTLIFLGSFYLFRTRQTAWVKK